MHSLSCWDQCPSMQFPPDPSKAGESGWEDRGNQHGMTFPQSPAYWPTYHCCLPLVGLKGCPQDKQLETCVCRYDSFCCHHHWYDPPVPPLLAPLHLSDLFHPSLRISLPTVALVLTSDQADIRVLRAMSSTNECFQPMIQYLFILYMTASFE